MKKIWMAGILLSGCLLLGSCSQSNDAGSTAKQEAESAETLEQGTESEATGSPEKIAEETEEETEIEPEIDYIYGEMTEDFYLVIEDTFALVDRDDVVIVGVNHNSPLYVNTEVDVITEDGRLETNIRGIEVYRKTVNGVEAETNVGVMLAGISTEDIQAGDIIVLRGCENPVEKTKQETAELISTILSTDYPEEKAYIPAYAKIIEQFEAEYDELGYDLIYLNEDELPELVVGREGYWVSVFTYANGEVHTLMDDWGYGAMGNMGYEYIPGENMMRNYNTDYAGAVLYTTYFGMDENQEIEIFVYLEMSCLDEEGNMPQNDEEYENAQWHFYVDDEEVSEEEYNSHEIDGDYEYINSTKTALEILRVMESETETVKETTVETVDDWAAAYAEYLDRLEYAERFTYSLIYVNEDDIPELVINTGVEAGGCEILTCYEDEVNVLRTYRLNFEYIERGNRLCNSDGLMGFYYDYVYSIIDGKWNYVAGGEYGDGEDGIQFDEDGNLMVFYSWEDTAIEEDVYEQKLKEVFDGEQAVKPEQYYTLQDIRSVLLNGSVASALHR